MSHSCYCGGRPAVAAVVILALQTMMAAPQMAYYDGYAAMAMQAIKAASCEDSRGYWCCVGGPSSSAALEQCCVGDSSSHVAM